MLTVMKRSRVQSTNWLGLWSIVGRPVVDIIIPIFYTGNFFTYFQNIDPFV